LLPFSSHNDQFVTLKIKTCFHTTFMTGTNEGKRSWGCDINSWITLCIYPWQS